MATERSAADTIGAGPSFGLPMSVSILRCSARHLRVRAEVFRFAEAFRQCCFFDAWRRAARVPSWRPLEQ
jgi:hypothetical protein